MSDESVERRRHPLEKRIGCRSLGERDRHDADRLGVGAVDHRALVRAERADAVAGAEEREVAGDDLVEEGLELGLDAVLRGGLLLGGIGRVERPAADEDARQLVEVEVGIGSDSSRTRIS